MRDPGLLDDVIDALDGGHRLADSGGGRQHAAAHRRAVEVHGAGPANADAAAELGAGQLHLFADYPEQGGGGVVDLDRLTVDLEFDHRASQVGEKIIPEFWIVSNHNIASRFPSRRVFIYSATPGSCPVLLAPPPRCSRSSCPARIAAAAELGVLLDGAPVAARQEARQRSSVGWLRAKGGAVGDFKHPHLQYATGIESSENPPVPTDTKQCYQQLNHGCEPQPAPASTASVSSVVAVEVCSAR